MTTAGWIFCAFCGVSVVISAAALVAMIFYVCSDKRESPERYRVIKYPVKPEPPKQDAAKECGVVKPKFDEYPKRKRKKIRIYFYGKSEALCFHDLAEFYRIAEVRKCDFSPSKKMEEKDRLAVIADKIARFFSLRGHYVRTISLYRKGKWNIYSYKEEA